MKKIFYFDSKTLALKHIPIYYQAAILLSIGCIGFGSGYFLSSGKYKTKFLSEEEKLIIIQEHNQFSEVKLVEKIKELNIKFPHIVLAQAKLETGNFTSKVFREGNNLFGMREAKQRITTALGTENNHAFYDTWIESVLDYSFYQCKYLSNITTDEQYFQYLEQSYAEDTTYVSKLKHLVKKENLKDLFK
jgi:uncharacterized FlgJ-related protein